jgi:hypothetical protein
VFARGGGKTCTVCCVQVEVWAEVGVAARQIANRKMNFKGISGLEFRGRRPEK